MKLAFEIVKRRGKKRLCVDQPRAVDKDVDPPVVPLQNPRQTLKILLRCYVALEAARLPFLMRRRLFCHILQRPPGAPHENDGRSFLGEPQGDGPSDPGSGTRYHGYRIFCEKTLQGRSSARISRRPCPDNSSAASWRISNLIPDRSAMSSNV